MTTRTARNRFIALLLVAIISVSGMALFKFFSSKRQSAGSFRADQVPPHQEDWAAYLSAIEQDKVGSIVVDLGLSKIAPLKQFPIRLVVDIKLRSPKDNGLPANEEFPILGDIEENLSDGLKKEHGSIFPGHLICEGTLSLYFYMSEPAAAKETVAELLAAYPNYKYETRISNEEKWEAYFELLYPEPIQMQAIQNDRLVQNISSQGDSLEKERQVDHWIYFSTAEDRSKFLKALTGKNFKVEGQRETDSDDRKPFQLHISRFDKVTSEAVNEYTIDLWQLAQDFNGEYDGWETSIVKD